MKNGARGILLPLGDILMLVLAFFMMLGVAFPGQISREIMESHAGPFSIVFGVWLFVFFIFNLYETESVKPTITNLKRIGYAYITALTASTIMFYTISSLGITPKTNLVIFSLLFVTLFIVWRRIFYSIFSVYFRKSLAFVVDLNKDDAYVKELTYYIKTYPQSGFFILGTYPSLKEFFEKHKMEEVDTLVVSKNILQEGQDIKLAYSKIKTILDLTYAYESILGKIPVDSIDETWVLYNIRSAGNKFYNEIIYLINTIIAIILLVITFPFLLMVALAVKLGDGGPVFYTQPRVGKGGKIFNLYKFRSMIINADNNGAEWTEKNDTRITKVGKIIRKLHIDEVPQLWNVLKREMAIVGPRPEIPSFEEKLVKEIPHYNLRHIITPGFTGWAQIKFRNARGISESKQKFEYDLYYIKNRNIFMDIGIILRTIIIIFTHN